MKKVGIIISNITNGAGTERAVSNLANILSKNGYEVLLISVVSTEGECKYHLNDGINIMHLGLCIENQNIVKKLGAYIQLEKKLRYILKLYQFDILFGTYSLYNCLISRFTKDMYTIGCEHFNYESAKKIHRFLRKLFYPKLSAIVVLTERDKNNYFFLKNVYVIPNSLSFIPHTFASCKNKEMISVGRMVYQKGFDLLIESAIYMKHKIPDWHLTIYGNGKEKEELKQKIDVYGLNDFISLHDFVSDIETVYYSASIYLSSSRYEGMPMVLLESQSCGLPAVAFDCPCGPSDVIINGQTGFLIPLANIQLFAEKVITLALDEQTRVEFGRKAVQESVRFSTKSIEKKWLTLIEKLQYGGKNESRKNKSTDACTFS